MEIANCCQVIISVTGDFFGRKYFLPQEYCKHINYCQNLLGVQDDGSVNRLSSYRRN